MGGTGTGTVATSDVSEPVSVDELKEFARIDYDDEDDLLETLITAARMAAEEYTGRKFMEQTLQYYLDSWPGDVVELPWPPLISVTKVVTLDEDDTETEYDSDDYMVILDGLQHEKGRVVIKRSCTPPVNTARDYSGFMIEYKAGYGDDPADVPQAIRTAIKIWAAAMHENRSTNAKEPPPDARMALDLFRMAAVMIR